MAARARPAGETGSPPGRRSQPPFESLPDPRDGDIEDDASNTTRHSLLRHASRLLLEINLPKFFLAVILALALPALLLGAAPKVGVWLVQATWSQTPDLGRVLTPLATAVALAGAAWFWGGTLLRLAEGCFWALNASFVQPLYVMIRELVRLAAEAFPPLREVAGTRSAAGLAAGGLIALGAAGVAWWAGPLPTFLPDDGSLEGLLWSVRAALANGVWAAMLYLGTGAVAWSLAEAASGAPESWTPTDAPDADATRPAWRVAHLSDVHAVGEPYGFRLESGRDGPRGNAFLGDVLAQLAEEDRAHRLDCILVTGDLTDAGRNAEFIALEDELAAQPGLANRLLALPGNHDVNIVDRANPARLELPFGPGTVLRRVRMLVALARLQGERVHVVDRATRRLGPTLAAFLAAEDREARLARFMDRGGVRAALACRRIWDESFPMIRPPSSGGLGVVLLNSCAETRFSFTNALGFVGGEQLRATEDVLAQFPDAPWLVALHHHLVEYPGRGVAVAERIGTVLVDGHRVLHRLQRFAPRIIVLHGHRHTDWMGRCGELRIVSAPSPVMGQPSAGRPPGPWIHHFLSGPGGGLEAGTPRRVSAGPDLT
ncbi:metallophosphoesterase family protein [Roseomonas sp. CCTCC AB2023176]|uniref:metallophosphoesterase family protein n=1 Tax=Roseomonas sp. CCTCC AB2023176 TaxID=3342640 RepID=UPI0035DCFA68